MKNILVFSASEDSKQSVLAAKYIESYNPETEVNPQDYITYNEEEDTYDFKAVAMYPHVYARNGVQSVVTLRVTDAQEAFIIALPNAMKILGECDNNPDSEYTWGSPADTAEFRVVVGQDFFTGSGTIGEDDYVAPRKKLAVLA